MHNDVYLWAPALNGTILEIGKMQVGGQRSPYQYSFGVNMAPGPGVTLVCDAVKLPLADECFHNVVCMETLEHIEDWRSVVSEMWRVASTTIVITTPTIEKRYHGYPSDYWRWTLEQWKRVFAKQKILRSGTTWTHGIGIWVRKNNLGIDLSVEPTRVTR